MTKGDIVNRISAATGLTKKDTAMVVDGVLDAIAEALARKERIEIRGFGVFKVVKRAPRVARNPKARKEIRIPERLMPVFKPSKNLRKRISAE